MFTPRLNRISIYSVIVVIAIVFGTFWHYHGNNDNRTLSKGTSQFPIPDGYCEFVENSPADIAQVSYMRQQELVNNIRFVTAFAQCEELFAWREGTASLENYGYVTEHLDYANLAGTSPEAFLASIGSSMRRRRKTPDITIAAETVKHSGKRVGLGLVSEEHDAVYQGELSVRPGTLRVG